MSKAFLQTQALFLALLVLTGTAGADLLADYRFEGNLNDNGGNPSGPFNGSPDGNPTYEAGVYGQAISLDGDDHIDCGNNGIFNTGGQITVACWIKVASFTKTWQAVLTKGDDSWRLHRQGDTNNINFTCNGLSTTSVTAGAVNVNDGQWHHVAGVYNGSEIAIYIDGNKENGQPATGTINTSTYPVHIGDNAQHANVREFHGLIDD
ncbi:MAG TPA: LamG domain-containing protein, partial [Candidatus Hydrogenedentes bacterium]|nr:LamG domain-containing protein [Candidatus Hydrogenedentota bacterium]